MRRVAVLCALALLASVRMAPEAGAGAVVTREQMAVFIVNLLTAAT